MTSRLSIVTAWLVTGHAILAGMFWLLLSVPESNVAMLIVSALLVVALAVGFGIVEGGALLIWSGERSVRSVALRALSTMPGVWLGLLLFVVAWLLVAHLSTSWQGHRGEIDAWLMAQFGWAETAKLHAATRWVFRFLSDVVGLSLALSLAARIVYRGLRSAAQFGCVRHALSPRTLFLLMGILLLFLWLPWRAVDWRLAGLSPNWQETTFVAVKLGVLYLLGNVGWALALHLTSSHLTPRAR
jgi:hypothetical protein